MSTSVVKRYGNFDVKAYSEAGRLDSYASEVDSVSARGAWFALIDGAVEKGIARRVFYGSRGGGGFDEEVDDMESWKIWRTDAEEQYSKSSDFPATVMIAAVPGAKAEMDSLFTRHLGRS